MSKLSHLIALTSTDVENLYYSLMVSQDICQTQLEECKEIEQSSEVKLMEDMMESLESTKRKLDSHIRDIMKLQLKDEALKGQGYNPRREY